jgi:chromosome segregation ATPase
MIAQQEERNQWIYRVRNEDTTSRTLIVEHPVRPGWTLATTPAPAETTVTAARFRVTVAAKGEATLTVSERRVLDTRYSIDQVDDRLITTISQRGILPDALRQALQPVLDKRAELAVAERELTDVNNQINTIGQDQARVRQNLQVLKGSAEEKALVKRYTTELNAQEDRLAAVRTQLTEATLRRDARRTELSQLIQRLTFVLDAPGAP